MPIDHFGTNVSRHLFYGESTRFFLDPCVKIHLEQYIAELLTQKHRIRIVDRLHDLIAFLNEIVADGLVCLFPVPWASFRAAQDLGQGAQIFQSIAFFVRKRADLLGNRVHFSLPLR